MNIKITKKKKLHTNDYKVITMEITNTKTYEYINTDKLEEYENPERESQYIQYLANKSREESNNFRAMKLKKAIESNDIDYLKFAYRNVPTYKLFQMLIGKILNRLFYKGA